MKSKLMKHMRYVFLAVGLYLFWTIMKKIGLHTVMDNMKALGWTFPFLLAISFGWYICYTEAWMQFLHRLSDGIRFWDLFRIKVTGEAVNTLTPANFIGGDPMRIYMLRRNFPMAEGAASVVVDRTLHSAGTLAVIVLGIAASLFALDRVWDNRLSDNLVYGVPLALGISLAFIIFVMIHQRRGFFSLIMRLCKFFGIKREFSERTVDRFALLDSHIIDFYNENHRGFLLALAFHILGRMLGVAEVYAVGRLVSDEFSIFAAIMLTALAPMINAVFAFIPGAFGVMEGAYSGMLYIMHMDPSIGITIQIAKRLRAAFWIGLGLFFLGAHGRKKMWEEGELISEA